MKLSYEGCVTIAFACFWHKQWPEVLKFKTSQQVVQEYPSEKHLWPPPADAALVCGHWQETVAKTSCAQRLPPERLIVIGSILQLNGLVTFLDNHTEEIYRDGNSVTSWRLSFFVSSPMLETGPHREASHCPIWERSHRYQRYSHCRHWFIKIIICFKRLKHPFSSRLPETNGGARCNQSISNAHDGGEMITVCFILRPPPWNLYRYERLLH